MCWRSQQVDEVLATGLYLPSNIYNMDECGFDLSTTCRTHRVGSRGVFIKAHSSLSTSTHITVIAAISTYNALIPHFLIYKGKYLMEDWVTTQDQQPPQVADVTDLSFSNTYMTIRWLTEVFETYTCD